MKAISLYREKIDLKDVFSKLGLYLNPKFWNYSPLFDVKIETPHYILKTANNLDQVFEAFKLRHQVFLGYDGADENSSYDYDEFDNICDHLIIIDKSSGDVCGTYRILSSLKSSRFYSETEFGLTDFLQTPGVKMELGRACIDELHRNGAVIDLLWKGIAQYAHLMNARYLFGCSSVKTLDYTQARSLYDFLICHNHHSDDFKIRSHGVFEVDILEHSNYDLSGGEIKSLMPSLLRSYLSAGARVYGYPAIDREFKCFDFFTVLDLENVSSSFKRRYFKNY